MGDRKLNLNQRFLSVRTRRAAAPAVTPQKEDNKMTLVVAPRPPTYKSEMKTGPITNPGAVPFLWEQMPGQPKEEIKPQAEKHKKPPVAPRLPPGRSPKANQSDSHNISKTTSESKSRTTNAPLVSQTDPCVDEIVKNTQSKQEKTEELTCSDSEDSDETFVDALDTLSRTESAFINCSVSGVSGMDDLDSKPMDPKTREFMMDRFLPAAKAMVSETPHVAPKRQQPVVRERTQVKKAEDQVKPTLRYGPSFTNRYSHYTKDEEEEDSDNEYDHSGNLPGVCGLFPRFCLKSPVYLLNPAPSMSTRTRVPMSPANKIIPKSASAGSYGSTGNESKSDASQLSIYKTRAAELKEKTSLRNGNATYHDAPPLEGKEVCVKQVNNTLESDGKGIKTFKDFLSDPDEYDAGPVVFERTVYVDTVHKTGSPKSRSSSSPHVEEPQGAHGSSEEDYQMITKSLDQMLVADSFFDDLKKIGNEGFGVSSIDKWNKKQGTGMQKGLEEDVFIKFQSTLTRNAKAAEEDSTRSIARRKFLELPGPPPLPKSPSDSWLGRTLPSISAKNRSYLGTPTHHQNQSSKPSTGNFKWEAIVKSTNAERQHLRSSEELLTPIPEA